MSQRGYSPRRYGRSEHAPIVIDIVDYGADEYVDEFTYAGSHYSSPRHSNSMQSAPHLAGSSSSGVGIHHTSSPHHQLSPSRHTTTAGTRHTSTQPSTLRHSSSSTSQPTPLTTSPRQSVHMHNFAQRRSFMMGGFERPEDFQQPSPRTTDVDTNRVYRVETEDHLEGPLVSDYDAYAMDRTRSEGIVSESEYRQSPGRSRNAFRQVDTRDRSNPSSRIGGGMHRQQGGGLTSHNSNFGTSSSKGGAEELTDDIALFGGTTSRFESNSNRRHLETTTPSMQQHQVHHNMTEEPQGATFPVFDRMKRPEESVFTFDSAADNDVHTVTGVINRPNAEGGGVGGSAPLQEPNHSRGESMTMASPEAEKKVFYFDIDDLSQRLLNSGDQDLSRRLRKKKAKNARSRISRNRARRKSKKSVFNLELDTSATSVLHGNDSGVTAPDQLGLGRTDSSKGGGYSNRFDSRSVAGSDARSALYVDTSADIDSFTNRNPTKSPSKGLTSPTTRSDNSSIPLRRSPSVGSPPAEHQKQTLSPDATMIEPDTESVQQEKPKQLTPRAASPRDPTTTRTSPRHSSVKPLSPRHAAITNHESPRSPDHKRMSRNQSEDLDKATTLKGKEPKGASPKHGSRISTSPTAASGTPEGDAEPELSPRKIKNTESSSELRVTQVYDEISDRLDHIVQRENDVENRQKAIRAVFEEVQQHVADLRKQKTQGKVGSSDKQDAIVDLVSISDKPKRKQDTDEGDDQVLKRQGLNESSDAEDIMVKLEKNRSPIHHPYRQPDGRPKVRSPTIEDMVSPPIAPIAPPSPIAPLPVTTIASIAVSPRAATSKSPSSTLRPSGAGMSSGAQITPGLGIDNGVIDVDNSTTFEKEANGINVEEGPIKGDQDAASVVVIDLEEKDTETQKDLPNSPNSPQKGGDSTEKRPSGYLSSDHSCDDDIVIQKRSTDLRDKDGANDVVYVIEEDDGKSLVHIQDKTVLGTESEPRAISPKNSDRVKAGDATQDFIDGVRSSHSGIKEVRSDGEGSAVPHPLIAVDDHEAEDRLEPDGNRLESNGGKKDTSKNKKTTKENVDNSDDGESLVGLASKTMEEAKKRSGALNEGVLDDSDTQDDANVDIDKEFDAVVPLGEDDAPTVSYNIDETINRVARQKELEDQQKREKKTKAPKAKEEQKAQAGRAKSPKNIDTHSEPAPAIKAQGSPMSRREEEERANVLLDTLSNGSLFSGVEDIQTEVKPSSPRSQQLGSGSNLESFIDLEDEEDDDDDDNIIEGKRSNDGKSPNSENEVVSLDYDFNLAISAGSKSSSSTSDLREFPMTKNQSQHEEDEDDEDDEDDEEDDDDSGSVSSNVSSDISESTSGSETDSSYDSFISIVETEDESDLEFFDDNEGFAENFMSNLVSSTFGWFEKKQEQLVCGFKSGEFDGPSLLRESMTRQKNNEQETNKDSRNNKAMKSLRNAVANKYNRDSTSLPPTASAVVASERKGRSSHNKKSSRRNEASEPAEERKRSRRKSSSPQPKETEIQEVNSEDPSPPPSKANEKARKKSSGSEPAARPAAKSERVKQHVVDSRKRSLVDQPKGSDSDHDATGKGRPANDEKRKSSSKKVHTAPSPQQDEATVATTKTSATHRSVTSKKSTTSRTSSRSQPSQASQPKSLAKSSAQAPNMGSVSQYNFDFLSSEDDDQADFDGASVQVIAVNPSVPESEIKRIEKESRKSSKTKKVDAPGSPGDQRKKAQPPATKPSEPERPERVDVAERHERPERLQPKEPRGSSPSKTRVSTNGEPQLVHPHQQLYQPEDPQIIPITIHDVSEPPAPKSKSKRSSKHSCKQVTKSSSTPPSPPTPRTPVEPSAYSPEAPQDTRASPSPPSKSRNRSPSPRRTKPPINSTGSQDAPPGGAVLATEKASKRRASSSKTSKSSKKSSKKDKASKAAAKESSKASVSSANRKSSRSGRKKIPLGPTASAKEDDTDTDGDSVANMNEEEREKARKERRRAAALKRRRKLRERRRAKLEQNLTDDTFG